MEINENNTGAAGAAAPATGNAGNKDTGKAKKEESAAAKPAKTKADTSSNKGKGQEAKTSPKSSTSVVEVKRNEAKEIAERLGVSELHENDKGEFFTRVDRALSTVGGDPTKLKKHTF